MADIVDKATRSRMMSGIRGKDTKPEIVVRSLLHRHGYRFRLHRRGLPGRPDLILPKYRTAVFVHGCYWHGHDHCHLYRLPKGDTGFWAGKISRNRERDDTNSAALVEAGWNVVVVWECAVMKSRRLGEDLLFRRLAEAIAKSSELTHIRSEILV